MYPSRDNVSKSKNTNANTVTTINTFLLDSNLLTADGSDKEEFPCVVPASASAVAIVWSDDDDDDDDDGIAKKGGGGRGSGGLRFASKPSHSTI